VEQGHRYNQALVPSRADFVPQGSCHARTSSERHNGINHTPRDWIFHVRNEACTQSGCSRASSEAGIR